MKFPRFWHEDAPKQPEAPQVVQLDPRQLDELASVFSAPRWLRDLGVASWLLVGAAALIVGLIFLASATATIVDPVVAGLILAVVTAPVVTWLKGHGVPRWGGAIVIVLAMIALGLFIVFIVVGGITSQGDSISSYASQAADKIQGWLSDLGLSDSASSSTTSSVKTATPDAMSTLVHGIVSGIQGLTSVVFFISFAVFSLFFLLKDGPSMRAAIDRRLGVPLAVAQTITGDVITSLRRYFLGVTIVAAFNAVVVGLGAYALGVPLAGTIAVVTFVTAYIPFIGAFVAGAFAVILALGSEGTQTALIMLVIVILANGTLQNIVQPIAFGATLSLNPLVVLIVTIGAGCLFGMIGLVLAAPLTSAAVHITGDLSRARVAARSESGGDPIPSPASG
ncbi:MAG TPA: AI-2E family transporter [Gaiellaceae bacterium]|nr:AI-2E family transporter [Gaiellaceae bacterium]